MIHTQLLSYNDRLAQRGVATIDLLVVHCTELPGLEEAREFGERIVHSASRTGNSGHYYIDRDGAIYQYVEDDRIAHHVREHNAHTIGIELVNSGRYPHWYRSDHQAMKEPYPPQQTASLVQLVAKLCTRYPTITAIAGHEDLDRETVAAEDDPTVSIRRKLDPGPLFPWDEVLARTGLARWGDGP